MFRPKLQQKQQFHVAIPAVWNEVNGCVFSLVELFHQRQLSPVSLQQCIRSDKLFVVISSPASYHVAYDDYNITIVSCY